MFSDAYARRRCIVPVDGFFEWRANKGARAKQPYAIAMKDGSPFGLAGIWENWRNPTTGEWERTFAIITVPSNELVAQIHNRMPDHIAAIRQVASPEFWPLFLGALFTGLRQGDTGLRQGDLRNLPWSGYDGTAITWRVTKRRRGDAGVKLTIPCAAALRSLLESLPRRGPLIF